MLLWSCSEAPIHDFENEALKVSWKTASVFTNTEFNYKAEGFNGITYTGTVADLMRHINALNFSSNLKDYKINTTSKYTFTIEYKTDNSNTVSSVIGFLLKENFISI